MNVEDKIEKITVDDHDFFTADLPAELKQLVTLYEETFARVKGLRKEEQILNFAVQQIGTTLIAGIRANQVKIPPETNAPNN